METMGKILPTLILFSPTLPCGYRREPDANRKSKSEKDRGAGSAFVR